MMRFEGQTAIVTGGRGRHRTCHRAAPGAPRGRGSRIWDRRCRSGRWRRYAAALGEGVHTRRRWTWPMPQAVERAMAAATHAVFGRIDVHGVQRRHHGAERAGGRLPDRRVAARVRRQCAWPVLLQPRRRPADAAGGLRAHRQHRLGRGQGRQSERVGVQRVEGCGDRVDEITGQGTRENRDTRELRPRRRPCAPRSSIR